MSRTLTNKKGLPQGIVNAVMNDPYNPGDSDISVTRLITPAYQRKLMATVDQVEDVADRIWALIGQATHTVLERGYPVRQPNGLDSVELMEFYKDHGYLVEERIKTGCSGWTVSGAFDLYENDTLYDYKITSVWSVMGEIKKEWEQQLNLLRLIAIRNGFTVSRLRIVAILRDWSMNKAKSSADYPDLQVEVVDIPVWTVEEAEQFMAERVTAHQATNPPPCTDEERWAKPDVFAVMKDGRKSAVKLHDNERDAIDHALNAGKGHTVVKRPGEFTRCASYCAVSHACPQYQSEVEF